MAGGTLSSSIGLFGGFLGEKDVCLGAEMLVPVNLSGGADPCVSTAVALVSTVKAACLDPASPKLSSF